MGEGEVPPKLPLIVAFGLLFGVMPLMPQSGTSKLAALVDFVYKRFGAAGLIGVPAVTLTMEKTCYDTYTAYYGQSIYDDAATKPNPHGGFPSGGAQLPSLSLIHTRKAGDPVSFRLPILVRSPQD